MFTISHAYLAVGIAGVAAFVLLLWCGQHHALAVAELGGTEVSAPVTAHQAAGAVMQRTITRSKAATVGLGHAAAGVSDLSSGFE